MTIQEKRILKIVFVSIGLVVIFLLLISLVGLIDFKTALSYISPLTIFIAFGGYFATTLQENQDDDKQDP